MLTGYYHERIRLLGTCSKSHSWDLPGMRAGSAWLRQPGGRSRNFWIPSSIAAYSGPGCLFRIGRWSKLQHCPRRQVNVDLPIDVSLASRPTQVQLAPARSLGACVDARTQLTTEAGPSLTSLTAHHQSSIARSPFTFTYCVCV